MRRRAVLALLFALACSDSEPAPPPPRLGGGGMPPITGGGGSDASTDGATGDDDAGVTSCFEVDGGPADPNRLFLSVGELALDFELGTVLAEWVTPTSCDATPQLRITLALPEAACTAAGPNRLTFVIDDPGELPNATSSTVTLADVAPGIAVRYLDLGDPSREGGSYGNCLGASGTITYEAMDTESGLKAAVFDLDLTRCDAEAGAILSATGAFEVFLAEPWRDVCVP
jgi:hypothetical protein